MDMLVNIDVPDLDLGLAFYREAFALTVGRRFGTDGVELLGGPVPIYLLVKPAGSPAGQNVPQTRDYARHWTPVHLDMVVADLDAAVARAERAGAIRETPVRSAAWGRIAVFADPFGHGFCLLEFTPQGYDAVADHACSGCGAG